MLTTRILIVEDERIIARGIEKRLRGLGYSVVGNAGAGEEAVRQALEFRPDLILMDINLGQGMDGVDAAAAIRAQADIPVVFLTAFSDDATLQRAKQSDPFGYLLKPYEDKDLQTAIEIGLYRHRMERRLRENEQWLAATLSSIGDAVIATDQEGRVRFLNTLAQQFTGWTQAEALGRDVREVFTVIDEFTRQPVQNPALEALSQGAPAVLAPDSVLVDKWGNERPIDDSAAPIRGMTGQLSGAVLVFRDVTERRRLEEHLRQAQKLEAIGRLAGGIAHDFNNIMTIITGFSELLLADKQLSGEQLETVRHIQDAGKRAASLTNQIMAFSRKQLLVPSVLSLNSIVRDMATMAKRLIGTHIELQTDLDPDLGPIRADPTQLGQVILNLAANARDAMPNGGRLVIATTNVELGETTTRDYPDVTPGRYARLTVTDTGSGISGEVLRHIFEPYFTTKGLGQGTGLGLATVHGIVKQSDGHIEVQSRSGEGTAFQIYLPLVEEAPVSAVREGGPTETGQETLLLVEDDPMVRKMTCTILTQSGYHVLEAANGPEALQVAEQHPEPIRLLVTDLVMPHLSGYELAELLSASRPEIRVLFISGYTEEEAARQGIATAAADFLQKPFSLGGLTSKVREMLDRE